MIEMVTKVEGLIADREEKLKEIANIIAKTINEKKKTGKLTDNAIDTAYNSLKGLSEEEKNKVLLQIIKLTVVKTKDKDKSQKHQKNNNPFCNF